MFSKTYQLDREIEASNCHRIDLKFVHRQIVNAIEEYIVNRIYVSIDRKLIHVYRITHTLHQYFSYRVLSFSTLSFERCSQSKLRRYLQ